MLEAGAIVFDRLEAFYRDREPTTIIHGDFRLDNLMFHPDTVTVPTGRPAPSVPPRGCRLLRGSGAPPELRRAHEVELFEHYHRGSSTPAWSSTETTAEAPTAGAPGPGWSWRVGVSIVERTERGDDMFMAMASRHALQALDLDAGELLDD